MTARARDQFTRYLDLLLAWNRVHRLTGFSSPFEVAEKLFMDSALFLPLFPPRPVRVADIGAGAGIPGLPLRILDPGIALTLIESRRKAVSFLSTVRRELDLMDVTVLHGRAELIVTQNIDLQGMFDVIVLRAVDRDAALLQAVRAYLKPGGAFIASGPPPGETSQPAAPGYRTEIKHIRYPDVGVNRTFVVGTVET
ncbi:MAG TPA: 16S rRNA (guanine(527)-N(7))-methyltransferase RsmG [Longimicrobiaceae bacterium]|nr:16S rRNA (guanine(527)-N(7))-methyltransferase RsmG [Longimicrobiaceae bacterium]